MPTTLDQARAAKRKLAALLRNVPDVNGIGIISDRDGYALKVNLSTPGAKVPKTVDRVPVRVEVVGRVASRRRAAG